MSNLKLVSAVKKSLCPNCGEDLEINQKGDLVCQGCEADVTPLAETEKVGTITRKEFETRVIGDILRDSDKFPLLRTPELLPLWRENLELKLIEVNERIGSLNIEIKHCDNEATQENLTRYLNKEINFRTKIRARLFEANRLSGVVNPRDSLVDELKKIRGELKNAKTQIEQLKAAAKDRINPAQYAAMTKKYERQVEHAAHLQKQNGFYRFGLDQIKAIIQVGGLDKDLLLNIIDFRLDAKNMEKYVKGD